MNSYEAKQEARRDRYQTLASKRATEAHQLQRAGFDALRAIPFGQPILVGHHSETRDRAYRARAVGQIDRSFELGATADYYERKAEGVGAGGISQDDPDALAKLKTKLQELETNHAALLVGRKSGRLAGEERVPGFAITNSAARIRATKKRIEQLLSAAKREAAPDVTGPGFVLRENKAANRLQFLFDAKPSEAVRLSLRRGGFRWSPTAGAWQTWLNVRGRWHAERVIAAMGEEEGRAVPLSDCSVG
ncbi:MAG: DUF3560 domain-containing protein [Patescibacteria group bacterium]